MPKLCEDYAEIMRNIGFLCGNYARFMRILCEHWAKIMRRLCEDYARITTVINT